VLTGAVYPVTFSWNSSTDVVPTLHIGEESFILRGEGSACVMEASRSISIGIAESPYLPSHYALEQNYPNPFNPGTVIHYEVPEKVFVSLKVYDLLGREIQTLVDGIEERGRKSVPFNAAALSSGVYFYRLSAGNFSATRKLLVTK
jgi:hypothetical protein